MQLNFLEALRVCLYLDRKGPAQKGIVVAANLGAFCPENQLKTLSHHNFLSIITNLHQVVFSLVFGQIKFLRSL